MKHVGLGPYHSRIESYGVSIILGIKEQELIRQVGLSIVNDNMTETESIAAAIAQPASLVNHAIDRLEKNGHLNAARSIGGTTFVVGVNATLRRALAS
jgi:hypothetical protein